MGKTSNLIVYKYIYVYIHVTGIYTKPGTNDHVKTQDRLWRDNNH